MPPSFPGSRRNWAPTALFKDGARRLIFFRNHSGSLGFSARESAFRCACDSSSRRAEGLGPMMPWQPPYVLRCARRCQFLPQPREDEREKPLGPWPRVRSTRADCMTSSACSVWKRFFYDLFPRTGRKGPHPLLLDEWFSGDTRTPALTNHHPGRKP